ncbi:uncharacterized protein LOC105645044 [Jatropha curcas]|uniref:uncharacterized protein LOC105645044 n=1 Tax=Jatropha curcas TaxID=180498 RepID=UPI0009D6F25A|nr:uncharacterized protein LOC105645044 [Jatropha curcas]
MLRGCYNAQCVSLHSDNIKVLSMFPDLFETEPYPFMNLKYLKFLCDSNSSSIPFYVMSYLLSGSPDVEIMLQILKVSIHPLCLLYYCKSVIILWFPFLILTLLKEGKVLSSEEEGYFMVIEEKRSQCMSRDMKMARGFQKERNWFPIETWAGGVMSKEGKILKYVGGWALEEWVTQIGIDMKYEETVNMVRAFGYGEVHRICYFKPKGDWRCLTLARTDEDVVAMLEEGKDCNFFEGIH